MGYRDSVEEFEDEDAIDDVGSEEIFDDSNSNAEEISSTDEEVAVPEEPTKVPIAKRSHIGRSSRRSVEEYLERKRLRDELGSVFEDEDEDEDEGLDADDNSIPEDDE